MPQIMTALGEYIPSAKAIQYHKDVEAKKLADPDTEFPCANWGMQTEMILHPAPLIIYGGNAGGGKSHGLLLKLLQGAQYASFRGAAFRTNTPELRGQGGLVDESQALFSPIGEFNKKDLVWECPVEGTKEFARVDFKAFNRDDDVTKHQGLQYGLTCIDEGQLWSGTQIYWLIGRQRSVKCELKEKTLITCNPLKGSEVHNIIKGYFLDEKGYAILERCGITRYMARHPLNGTLIQGNKAHVQAWIDEYYHATPEELRIEPMGYTFINSSLKDNPYLTKDKSYMTKLALLPPVEQARQLGGCWEAVAEGGDYWKHEEWIEDPGNMINPDELPNFEEECRGWDLAWSEADKKGKSKNPDYTVGAKIGRCKLTKEWYIIDVVYCREEITKVYDLIKETAIKDGITVTQSFPIDPAGGKAIASQIQDLIAGYPTHMSPERHKKHERFMPVTTMAKQGKFHMVRGEWNNFAINQMESFPMKHAHDDVCDAMSRAFAYINDTNDYNILDM